MLSYTGESRFAFYSHVIWRKAQQWNYSKEHNEFLVYMLRTLVSIAFTGTMAPKSFTDAFIEPLSRPIIIKLCEDTIENFSRHIVHFKTLKSISEIHF